MNDINSTCECGYEFEFFFTPNDEFPEFIECPICNREYKVKDWYPIDNYKERDV